MCASSAHRIYVKMTKEEVEEVEVEEAVEVCYPCVYTVESLIAATTAFMKYIYICIAIAYYACKVLS